MDQAQTKTLSLQAAYAFGIARGLHDDIEAIRNMVIEWDKSYTSSLRRGYIVELFEERGIFEEFKEKHWSYGNTRSGETMRRRFIKIKTEYEDFLVGRGYDDELDEEVDQEFAAESDLRDFLTKNLSIIEAGLVIYESGGRNGVEFPINGGRIDILGVDRDGRYVVIELKISRGREKTLGQIIYYMAWVDENLGNGPCRGVIIAREIPDELVLAARRVEGISLFQYKLSVSLEEVQ